MKIAYILVLWSKLVLRDLAGSSFINPKLQEAIILMESNQDEYQNRFARQLMIIRRTGFIAIFISIIGSCIVLFSKP
jgi:hypothetical protein